MAVDLILFCVTLAIDATEYWEGVVQKEGKELVGRPLSADCAIVEEATSDRGVERRQMDCLNHLSSAAVQELRPDME